MNVEFAVSKWFGKKFTSGNLYISGAVRLIYSLNKKCITASKIVSIEQSPYISFTAVFIKRKFKPYDIGIQSSVLSIRKVFKK